MNEGEALEVLDGLMLGDGGIHPNGKFACFAIALSAGDPNQWKDTPWSGGESKIPEMQYLMHIMTCLEPLGIKFCSDHPKAVERVAVNGKPYLCCYMTSLISYFLLEQWKRWYRPVTDEIRRSRGFAANRKFYKILPDDIGLTSLAVATWFEGDGNARRLPTLKVQLSISTNNFDRREVEKLSELLSAFNIRAKVYPRPLKTHMTWVLNIGAIESVNRFSELIRGHIHSCYGYKVMKAKHVWECTTENERKSINEANRYRREQRTKRLALLSSQDVFNQLRVRLREVHA